MNCIFANCIFAIILNHFLPFIRWFVNSSQVKFSWFSSSTSFPQMFSFDLLENIFCHSYHYREQKIWISFGARSGEYGGGGRTDQPKSSSLLR